MKVLLKDKESGGFLNAEGDWVSSMKAAQDFKTVAAAINRLRKLHPPGKTVVLLRFDHPQYDAELAIGWPGSATKVNSSGHS
jgi:hypothetical protein